MIQCFSTPFSRHSCWSCLLQPLEAWSQQRIHRKLNGLLQLQLKLPQGEGDTEKVGRLFKSQTYPSLTSCDVFRGTSSIFWMMAKAPPTSAFERLEGDGLVEDLSDVVASAQGRL